MPNENETRRCPNPGGEIGIHTLKAPIAGSQAGIGTPNGDIWAIPQQRAWLCNKHREHFELPHLV